MFKRIFWLSCLCSLSLSAQAATYYVSNSGNDSNDGLSPATAWQTLFPVTDIRFADGDEVLFERGSRFNGFVRIKASPINMRFGAYGDENLPKPVFSGSEIVTGWQPSSRGDGNIWEASVADVIQLSTQGEVQPVEHLFVNGELMTIARYPNVDSPVDKNWLIVDKRGDESFTDQALADYKGPDNYWKDATLRIRNYSWTLTVAEVQSFNKNTGRIAVAKSDGKEVLGGQLSEWGYFLDGVLGELDYPGEWYYDADSQKIYLYPKNGINPNQAMVEAAAYRSAFIIGNQKNGTVIENLHFKHYMSNAIHVNTSDNVTIQGCDFIRNMEGITVFNPINFRAAWNYFDWNLRAAFSLQANKGFNVGDSIVEHNQIYNTALDRLYGRTSPGSYQGNAIRAFGKAFTVRKNTIKNVGHMGIYLKGEGHHIIENNYVDNVMLVINDGGAIAIGSDGNQIRGNFLTRAWGNVDESNGCATELNDPCIKHPPYGMGVGADPGFDDNVIEGNVVANNLDMGIRLNSFKNTVVRNNIMFNNDPQLVIQDKKGPSRNNTVEGNLMVSLHPEQLGLQLTNSTNHGTFRNNTYVNFFNDLTIMRNSQRYSLKRFRESFSNIETGSKAVHLSEFEVPIHFQNYQATPVGGNLITNGTFDAEVSGWSPGTLAHDPNGINGGSLKADLTGKKVLNIIPNTLAINAGQWYRLRFSTLADGYGDVRIRVNETAPNVRSIILQERHVAVGKKRRDYEFVFQADGSYQNIKILLTLDDDDDLKTLWLDDVVFEPVQAKLYDAQNLVKLFMNPTETPKTEPLNGVQYYDLNDVINIVSGQSANLPVISGGLEMPAYSHRILIRTDFAGLPAARSLSDISNTVQIGNAGVQGSSSRFVGGFRHENVEFETSLAFERHVEADLNQNVLFQGYILPDPAHVGQTADIIVMSGFDGARPFSPYEAQFGSLGGNFRALSLAEGENGILTWMRQAPALYSTTLQSVTQIVPGAEMLQTPFSLPGTFYFMVGYRLADGTVVLNGYDPSVAGGIAPLAVTVFNGTTP